MNSYASHSFTGELNGNDSVLVSYDELRLANTKLLELEYEKSINKNLLNIISNDSIAICVLESRISSMDNDYKRNLQIEKHKRNIISAVAIAEFVLLIIAIF